MKNSKKKRRILMFLSAILAIILISSITLSFYFLRPLRYSDAEIKVYNFDYQPAFDGMIRQYNENSLVSFKNENCTFSSRDMNDYCEVNVNVDVYNRTGIDAFVNYIYPITDNDFVIFGIIPVATMQAPANTISECYSTFICLRNGKTDEEIINAMSEMDYKIVFGNSVLWENSQTIHF
jgi:hypothetical protein